MGEKYKELLKKYLVAMEVFNESGFSDMLEELEEEVKDVLG